MQLAAAPDDAQALADGLATHLHRLVVRVLGAQVADDLAGRLPLLRSRLDAVEERWRREPGGLGATGSDMGAMVRPHGGVAGAAVAGRQLAVGRRERPPDPGCDRLQRVVGGEPAADLLTIRDREVARPRAPPDLAGLAEPRAARDALVCPLGAPDRGRGPVRDRPSRRTLRTSRRCFAARCRDTGTSASSRLTVVNPPFVAVIP